MNDDGEQYMPDSGDLPPHAQRLSTHDETLTGLRDARREAVGLMQEAVDARESTERAMAVLQRSESRHAFLLMLNDALRSIADSVEIQNVASRVLGEYIDANRVSYAEIAGDHAIIRGEYVNGVAPMPGQFRHEAFGVKMVLHRPDRPIVSNDVQNDRHLTDEAKQAFAAIEVAAYAGVLLIKDGQFVAAFGAHSSTPRDWTDDDIHLIGETAERTWLAVERTRAERALRAYEERLRLLTDSFQDIAILSTDPMGIIAMWNPGAEKIFGYSESEAIGLDARVLFVPEDRAAGAPDGEMETARTRGRAADERWHLRKDGRRFYASGMMAPLYEGGLLVGYAKIARDLTTQKRAEVELKLQYEELESIVAGRTAELAEANEALRDQMEQRRASEEERFALLQKIVSTQEDERRRIARDMHDSLGQQLTALRLKLASLKTEFSDNGRLDDGLEQLQELGKRVDAEVNFLVWELRPTVLDDLGLAAAIENYASEWTRHYGIPTEVHTGRYLRDRLDTNIDTNLYRILQEALNNAQKHADARSVNIVLEARRKQIVMVVEDDGKGFDAEAMNLVRESGRGLGLIGMRERAAIIGGQVEIESTLGSGTTVFVRVPVRLRD